MPSRRGFARHFCALYSAECHLVRRTAGAAFPREEQTGVGIGYVIASLDAESARGFINPTGWAFDFPKIPDGRFIHDHVDETPIGNFGEIEGPARWIDETAGRLGIQRSDYITDTYAGLFFSWKRRTRSPANEMTFSAIKRAKMTGETS